MNNLLKKMDTAAYVLNKIAINITVLAVILMSVIIFVRVVLRYGFNSGLAWSEEISILLMMWVAFFGGSTLFYDKSNMAVTLIKEKTSIKINWILNIIFTVCTIAFMFIIFWFGLKFAFSGFDIKYGATGLPRFWSYISVSLGGSFILFYSLIDLIKLFVLNKGIRGED